ncbi:MAG: hypothetical protein ACYC4L_15815 [Chloroflexota bacterium]
MLKRFLVALGLAAGLFLLRFRRAQAHQPVFVDRPTSLDTPWPIADAAIATAHYATLARAGQVDYYAFEGQAGQSLRLGVVIPLLAGQEEFAPWLALLGSGLPADALPASVARPPGAGSLLLPPPAGPAERFEEGHSRTCYWRRQREQLTLPAAGRYLVAAWSPEGAVGRYVFSIGEQETPARDPERARKMRAYWTPLAE